MKYKVDIIRQAQLFLAQYKIEITHTLQSVTSSL